MREGVDFRDRPFVAGADRDAPIRLLATRCGRCEAMMFPPQGACGRCGDQGVSDTEIGPRGKIWSYTVQTFRPPSPPYAVQDADAFEAYGVGMVEFDGGLLVHGRLIEADRNRLAVGQAVEAVLQTLPAEGGGVIETYAFRTVSGESAQ